MGRPLLVAVLSFILLLAGLVLWANRVEIAGAVIGKGTVEVSTTMTAVQHPIGGIVQEIHVENGDRVTRGALLVRLDSRQMRSELNVVEMDLFEVLANIARLEAILDGTEKLVLPDLLAEAARTRSDVAALVGRQEKQLVAYLTAQRASGKLIEGQIEQVRAEISGVEAQLAAKTDELAYWTEEIARADELAERGLIKLSELSSLKRSEVAVRGDIGRFTAQIAQLRGKVSELELERLTLLPEAHDKAQAELSKIRPLRTRHAEQRATLLLDLSRLDIRAPISGRIHDSRLLGQQSVVEAAKPLMMIVPDDEPIRISVKVAAADIDQIHVGQETSLKFTTFGSRDVPILLGEATHISPDVLSDPVTKSHHYEVKVRLREQSLLDLSDRELLPGMPVDAFFSTEKRTPVSYVMRPLQHYIDRAFRDS
ncbi:HlyD family type I secretion periplasmic adaptor subunit [Pseudoponticoccus marisrubri]|uniref:Membrane fusion protein (MFP) family protein n=1 Tax=Pseudoponticoccus marisrubri TaxID=1685382 RepID=A0A0W7WEJ6_9RHOB|nr:HlyD family type I secretion periplasmic adaptor subunit [Pseudoponticoccus marisrubri]KUF08982.1 hypothetical protein AVJ23_20040 [Pseudoponticoccus marisrubri]